MPIKSERIRHISDGLVGPLADAEAEDGGVARSHAADRFQVCPTEAGGQESDAVAEQHRQDDHHDLVDETSSEALAGDVRAEDLQVLATRGVQCGGDCFGDVTAEVCDIWFRGVPAAYG